MSKPEPAMTPHHPDEPGVVTPPQGPDLLTLTVGLGALGVAGIALLSDVAWLPPVDARWLLAAIALIVGLTLIINSLRS
ncbi:MAG: hypothetical protein ACRDSR_22175 [Pseudonocardiaceae bacterium]